MSGLHRGLATTSIFAALLGLAGCGESSETFIDVSGGSGADFLTGGWGNDTLEGGPGRDFLNGAPVAFDTFDPEPDAFDVCDPGRGESRVINCEG